MTRRRSRWLGVSLLASAGVGLLEVASMVNPSLARADDTALIMGYASASDPAQSYVNEVISVFLNPTAAAFPGNRYSPATVPWSCPRPRVITSRRLPPASATWTRRSHSSSANTTTSWCSVTRRAARSPARKWSTYALPADQQPNPADLQFVLVEDLNNPNGGFLERFPFLATESFPATPADSPYPTISTTSSTAAAPTSRNTRPTSWRISMPPPAMLTCIPFCFPAIQRLSTPRNSPERS